MMSTSDSEKIDAQVEFLNKKIKRETRLDILLVLLVVILFIKGIPIAATIALALLVASVSTPSRVIKKKSKDPEWTEALAALRSRAAEDLKTLKGISPTASIRVTYVAGMEDSGIRGTGSVSAAPAGFLVDFHSTKLTVPWSEIEDVDAGTDEEIRSRLTVTRVVGLGVFALGAKKERKQNFYLTVSMADSVGLFKIETVNKKNKEAQELSRKFAVTCNSFIKSSVRSSTGNSLNGSDDSGSKLLKLNEMLENGLISRQEFDLAKQNLS